MAEITMKINFGPDVDRAVLSAWILQGVALDCPVTSGLASASAMTDTSAAMAVAAQPVATQPAVTEQPRQTAAADPVVAPKKRGRKSNAEKAAERAAAEQSGQTVPQDDEGEVDDADEPTADDEQPDAPSAMTEAIAQAAVSAPTTGPTVMALPPGVTMPTAAAAPPVVTAPEAAMPVVAPAPDDGAMTLEAFREMYRRSHMGDPNVPGSARPGKFMLLMRSPTWPDGSPKAVAFTMESVPATDYERYAAEAMMF